MATVDGQPQLSYGSRLRPRRVNLSPRGHSSVGRVACFASDLAPRARGSPDLGGPLVTSGLVFVAASMARRIRAFDLFSSSTPSDSLEPRTLRMCPPAGAGAAAAMEQRRGPACPGGRDGEVGRRRSSRALPMSHRRPLGFSRQEVTAVRSSGFTTSPPTSLRPPSRPALHFRGTRPHGDGSRTPDRRSARVRGPFRSP